MFEFNQYTIESAPQFSKEGLEEAKKSFSFVPNLQSFMAESPALLNSYSAVWKIFSNQTSFTPVEQQVVLLTVNYENRCHYCMAGHSALAKMVKMDAATLSSLRDGLPIADEKLEALRTLTRKVVRERGFITGDDVQAFLDAGYSKANVFDVVAAVALKIMSNYTNHIVETPLDQFMAGNEWTHPSNR